MSPLLGREAVFHRFHDIEQFRHVCKYVRTREIPGVSNPYKLPVLKFTGTVKLHGTNACILFHKGDIRYQSREHLIDTSSDNAGFATYMSQFETAPHGEKSLRTLVGDINHYGDLHNETAVGPTWIYGEWCGGNVQSGVALNQLQKMFVIFGIRVGETWLDMRKFSRVELPEFRIFNIMNFPTFEMEIDFAMPEAKQNELVAITQAVEAECPVAKQFGVSGVGEGVVWTSYLPNGEALTFKVKGEKHSVSKVKTLASVDVEKVNNIKEFVDYAVTDNRLAQGVDVLRGEGVDPEDIKNMGKFLKWVANDVFKEESDTMTKAGLDKKDVGKYISDKAKKWLMTNHIGA